MDELGNVFNAVMNARSWMGDANCKNMDTNLFFPTNGQNVDPFALEVCGSCTVTNECLWYANETHANFGVFGGLSYKGRMRWRSKNRIQLGMSEQDWEASRKAKR
jgi:WhiB family transcriptional regulator, redox-sensing transcriptional regulator